jgi:hypothetical protein
MKGLSGTQGVIFFGFGIMFLTMLVFGRAPDSNLMENNQVKIRPNDDPSETPYEVPLSLYKHVVVKDPKTGEVRMEPIISEKARY